MHSLLRSATTPYAGRWQTLEMKNSVYIAIILFLTACSHINVEEERTKGITYYENKEYDKAIEVFSKVINQTDSCSDCFLYRGFSYRDIERPEEARADFTRLINSKNDIDKKVGYVNRGGTFYDQRKYELALQDYKQALEYEPQNETILNMVSHMCFATGDKDSGCYYYWESVKIADTEFNPEIPKYCVSLSAE